MPDTSKEQVFGKKGFEIAYAVFRVAANQDPAIKSALYAHAIGIMESAGTIDKDSFNKHLAGLENILRIIAESGLIRQNHSQLIIAELRNLNSAMNSAPLPNSPEIELGNIFTPLPKQFGNSAIRQKETRESRANALSKESRQENVEVKEPRKNSAESGVRKEAILSKIRQAGSCRLRDIQEALPDISDRTLRYDVQELMVSGEVERIGGGGPATYYRARPNAAISVPEESPKALGNPLP